MADGHQPSYGFHPYLSAKYRRVADFHGQMRRTSSSRSPCRRPVVFVRTACRSGETRSPLGSQRPVPATWADIRKGFSGLAAQVKVVRLAEFLIRRLTDTGRIRLTRSGRDRRG